MGSVCPVRSLSNRTEDQEIAVLCLHLLQASLVYINTLMIQEVLDDDTAGVTLDNVDRRGLTPLTYTHVNPYGIFELDLDTRCWRPRCLHMSRQRSVRLVRQGCLRLLFAGEFGGGFLGGVVVDEVFACCGGGDERGGGGVVQLSG
jgi:hypothetical protein